MKTYMMFIDAQRDFCEPGAPLYVPGAEEDMNRASNFLSSNKERIYLTGFTLDSHHLMQIFFPDFWWDPSSKESPKPYDVISHEDVKKGVWVPRFPNLLPHALRYTKTLEDHGRYQLTIWPLHCLIGSTGASLTEDVMNAMLDWEKSNKAIAHKITKGSNWGTEHYSALQADCEDPEDPSTSMNTDFIFQLQNCDRIIVVGEASSHCVKFTVTDLIEAFATSSPEHIQKLVLFEDCMSPVGLPIYKQEAQDFFHTISSQGVTVTTSEAFKF